KAFSLFPVDSSSTPLIDSKTVVWRSAGPGCRPSEKRDAHVAFKEQAMRGVQRYLSPVGIPRLWIVYVPLFPGGIAAEDKPFHDLQSHQLTSPQGRIRVFHVHPGFAPHPLFVVRGIVGLFEPDDLSAITTTAIEDLYFCQAVVVIPGTEDLLGTTAKGLRIQ